MVLKRVWIQFGRVFPSLNFSIPFFIDFFPFYSCCPTFSFTLHPPFLGSGSPSWDSNCYIVGKRGISRLPQRFWEKRNCRDSVRSCSHSLGDGHRLGICLWSVYSSGWYSSLVGPFVEGSLPVFCSYHSAEVVHLGVGMMTWPSWYSYLLNS